MRTIKEQAEIEKIFKKDQMAYFILKNFIVKELSYSESGWFDNNGIFVNTRPWYYFISPFRNRFKYRVAYISINNNEEYYCFNI